MSEEYFRVIELPLLPVQQNGVKVLLELVVLLPDHHVLWVWSFEFLNSLFVRVGP